mmetsp:Transcript_11134/g.12754  ORF Transcript_11134/g.12754 Transcript_11134/m.12754 type:complete len:375 (+) Transcript_11134:169-1293(+)
MALIGTCFKLVGVLVAILAVGIGFLTTEYAKPVFKFIDQFEGSRGTFFKGMMPAFQEHEPWGFTHEELGKLNLKGEVIVVTGANVGLGYWTAHNIAGKTGATVVLACRSKAKCDKAAKDIKKTYANAKVDAMTLDLGSFTSIRKFAKEFNNKYSMLDSLILNAGIMVPPFRLTEDGLESQIGVNHFGHFLLTDLLIPKLEKAAKEHGVATVVPVTSAAHYDSYPIGIKPTIKEMNDESTYDRRFAYGQSKLANVLFAQELAERYKSKNILVNSVHPGGVDTELARHIVDDMDRLFGIDSISKFVKSILERLMWTPEDASLTQIYAAVSDGIRKKKVTGKYFHPIARETVPDPHTRNKKMQKHLWKITEEFIAKH